MEDNNAKNYFEVLKKLKEFEYKLVQQYKKWTDVTVLGLEIKSYIWDIPYLKEKYLEKIKFVQDNAQSSIYLKKMNENYFKIQQVNNETIQNCYQLRYSYTPKKPFEEHGPTASKVDAIEIGAKNQNLGHVMTVYDFPFQYIYRSVMLQFLSINNTETTNLMRTKIDLKPSLKAFYVNINSKYSILDFPDDIEFLISSINTISSPIEFDCCIYVISLLYVVRELEFFVMNKIGNEYFDSKNNGIQEAFGNCELTEKDQEVYNIIQTGKTRKETANELGVGETTIQKHIEHIGLKMGVKGIKSIRKSKKS